ncbi:hypothetical protein APG03_10990 [Pseudomonas aeruginosa]|nr:hypothetical protein APG03_10990 [Pseudomonas aeruginosa]
MPAAEVRYHWISTLVRRSPEVRAASSRGEALSKTLVMTTGLCTRWPVGWPDCGSRGMITSWLKPWTIT